MRGYGLTSWSYSRAKGDPLTGLVERVSDPDTRIVTAGRYQSTRSLLWQLREYETAMLGPVPKGMESVAAAYGAHIAGMRVVA